MPSQQPLDQVPILVLIGIFIVINAATYEVGFRIGRWSGERGGQADRGMASPTFASSRGAAGSPPRMVV